MPLARLVHRLALRVEAAIDRLRPPRRGPRVLEPYRGYATPGSLVLRGRVLTGLRAATPRPEQSRWTNLRQMVGLFLTSEVDGVRVVAPEAGVAATSDEEGYVTLEVPRDGRAGWIETAVEVAGDPGSRRAFPAYAPGPEARRLVISDIDDTVLETGAYSLLRNLWTTFTGSAATRRIFPDAVAAMERLTADGRDPLFYVSSSPWNLHRFLEDVFARAGLRAGPMILRDLGLSETQFVAGGHGGHKGAAIDAVLAANPGLPAILVGDTGQKDARVYRAAIRRHPGRIAGVVLREPRSGPDAETRRHMAAIERAGVPLLHAPDFSAVPAAFGLPR
jgi:phosphatidate phosphatase APP1